MRIDSRTVNAEDSNGERNRITPIAVLATGRALVCRRESDSQDAVLAKMASRDSL